MDTDEHDTLHRIDREVSSLRERFDEAHADHEARLQGLEGRLSAVERWNARLEVVLSNMQSTFLERMDHAVEVIGQRIDAIVLRQGEDVGRDEANAKSRALWVAAASVVVTAALAVAGWLMGGSAG